MNETVEQYMMSKDAQERCSNWVEYTKDASPVSEGGLKRRRESESEEFIETDSEFDSVSECGGKKRRVGVSMKSEILNLTCEWRDCSFNTKSLMQFIRHVANHIPELDVKITNDIEAYACLWSGCSYETSNDTDIMRHVNYHSFHTKLKCIGTNVRERTKLPKCHRDADWSNILDGLPPHECQWNKCEQRFNNYQLFLDHVFLHLENERDKKCEGQIFCSWAGCKNKYPTLPKLRDHVRIHTKEKIIACPKCGTMFASNTKFNYHCKRQIPLEVQGFQCSHCNKFYPTECILREHMRSHIFHYKCDLCDMSCDSPSGLAKHKLYRHSTTRQFPCSLCSHAAKSQQDLHSHMIFHTNGQNFACEVEGCSYTCKNIYTLDRHVEKVHRSEIRWYCCHECPIKYRKSFRLTKHLIEAHHLQWLRGHKRFQYILQEDGCYRLQTVRYETVEENESTVEGTDSSNQNETEKASVLMQNEASNNGNNEESRTMSIPNILISIDEIDEHGNIINSKIIETQETSVLPSSAGSPVIIM